MPALQHSEVPAPSLPFERREFQLIPAVIAMVLAASPAHARDDTWREAALHRAVSHHQAHRPLVCGTAAQSAPAIGYELHIGEDTAARRALLVRFACRQLDHGESFVFLLSDEHGAVSNIVFPTPLIAGLGAGPVLDAPFEGSYRREVLNAEYDPDGRTMVAIEAWRHTGEIRTRTQWGYRLGMFRLMRFEVDRSPGGRQDLELLIDNDIW